MKLEDKIKELEGKKKELMTNLLENTPGKNEMSNLLDYVNTINFALKQLKDIDIEIVDDDSILDVDAIIEKVRQDKTGIMGETTYSIQRLLFNRVSSISNKTGAKKIITNGNLASVLQDIVGYTLNPVKGITKIEDPTIPYPMGNIGEITLFVDAMQRWDDNRIVFYKEENESQHLSEMGRIRGEEVFTLKVKDTQGVLI